MGYGDSIIGSGMARGLFWQGKLAAFGDGSSIKWSTTDYEIFKGNPNVAVPGVKYGNRELVWIDSYTGHRPYGRFSDGRWRFVNFRCPPGEIFLTSEEKSWAMSKFWHTPSDPIVVIEPRVKPRGACDGHNKQWPVAYYDALAAALRWDGDIHNIRVVQFVPPGKKPLLKWAEPIKTETFRHALAALGVSSLYIGPEGGLHHGAAAVGTPAVVIFGGFNSPHSTGYPWHENIAVGEPCGTFGRCQHCEKVMASISVERVLLAAQRQLGQKVAA